MIVIKKDMNRLRILSIVRGKEERRMDNIKSLHIQAILTIQDLIMKLHNLLSKMTIVHRFQQATGPFNSEHTAVKRSSFVMSQVVSTLCPLLTINTEKIDSLQLLKINKSAKDYIKLKELQTNKISLIIVLKETNKTIAYKEVSAKIYIIIKINLNLEIAIQESHFRIKRKTSLLKVI